MVETTPVGEIEAMPALLLVHEPPALGLKSELSPMHRLSLPSISILLFPAPGVSE